MSTPILPFAVWASGTNQNSIPANDNSLRNQILNGLVISDSTDAQPVSPSDGDIYIMTGAASGDQWSLFDEYDLAIFDSGTWYAFAPVDGISVNLAGTWVYWSGAAYVPISLGGAGAPVIELAGTAYDMGDLTPGAWHVFTSGSAVTITVEDDSVEPVPANAEYGLEARGSGGVTLVEDNLATIIPPKGGTLEMEEADFAVLKRTDEDEYKLVGSTVAA